VMMRPLYAGSLTFSRNIVRPAKIEADTATHSAATTNQKVRPVFKGVRPSEVSVSGSP
jgi:hypothetical protein